ncbi:MAG: Electron transport complex subunit RsxD [SAR92 bacterium MED-G29]|jgi:electron transport complex protein RnfD|nr:MAG: Electron transport complex subunit RsxD [SAR92 bacterium MED-G29]|tara:strand:- start:2171 stop:3238 length:1068 start_codon:yes stop_codon:yes gene_type:complete
MAFKQITSPHAHASQNTSKVMQLVVWATVPGLIALTYHFGWGSLINVVLATATAVIAEAAVLQLRGRSIAFYLRDYSAVLTAVLLGLALPPLAPWWVVVVGTLFSIVIAKQLYGGLGYNPFNPAMVGYVILLISFPIQMTTWITPLALLPDGVSHPGIIESLSIVFAGLNPADGVTGATPLDSFKFSDGLLVDQIYAQNPLFSQAGFAGVGWEWVNVGFLIGGLILLGSKIFTWHGPVAMLGAIAVMSILFWDGGSSDSPGSALMHLFSGASMMGAFFIMTDPVSSAASNRGRLIYGALIGVLVYLIRAWGNYPDAVAFAVLLANFAAPFIDNYTLPRTYGHIDRRRATEKEEDQ